MNPGRKWLKLYVGWSDSDWLSELKPEARLCWPLVLEYVKCVGSGGTVLVRSSKIAAFFSVPSAWIDELLAAAVAGEAVSIEDGHITVLNWANYQSDPTAPERKARYVEAKKAKNENAFPPFQSVPERQERNGTARTTEKEKEKEKEKETVPVSGKIFVKPSPDDCSKVLKTLGRANWERDGSECWRHWEALGWKMSSGSDIGNWRSAVGWWHKDHPEKPKLKTLTAEELELINR